MTLDVTVAICHRSNAPCPMTLFQLPAANEPLELNASGVQARPDTQSHLISRAHTSVCSAESIRGVDTEAGMLSGISRERSIRSNPYWFTEFCNSQCSSHFAAPFIVVRAETSVAESCKRKGAVKPLTRRYKLQKRSSKTRQQRQGGIRQSAPIPWSCPRCHARGKGRER